MQPQVTGRRPCPWGSQVGNAGKPSGGGGGQRAGEAKGAGPGVGGHLRGGARAENLMGDHRQPPPHTKATNVWILCTHTHTYNRYTYSQIHKYAHQNADTPPKSVTLCICVYHHTHSLMHTHTLRCALQPQILRLTGAPQHTPPSTLALATRQPGPASLRPWPRLP